MLSARFQFEGLGVWDDDALVFNLAYDICFKLLDLKLSTKTVGE